jgi:mono/diheme cytochrome c family protein
VTRVLAAFGVLLLAACISDGPSLEVDPEVVAARAAITEIPAEHAEGDAAYQRDCARCHGEDGLGTESGPPLLHPIYQPTQHPDAAFLLAVRTGVDAHHWDFGDKEALPGVSPADVGRIVSYIRWLQREVGIY